MPSSEMGSSPWLQTPNRKVSVGALAGAITILLVWVLNTYVVPATPIPSSVAAAITTLLTFLMSYFVPEPTHS